MSEIFEAALRVADAAGTCLPPCAPRLPLDRMRRPSALVLRVFSSRGVPIYWLSGVASVSACGIRLRSALAVYTRNKLQND